MRARSWVQETDRREMRLKIFFFVITMSLVTNVDCHRSIFVFHFSLSIPNVLLSLHNAVRVHVKISIEDGCSGPGCNLILVQDMQCHRASFNDFLRRFVWEKWIWHKKQETRNNYTKYQYNYLQTGVRCCGWNCLHMRMRGRSLLADWLW